MRYLLSQQTERVFTGIESEDQERDSNGHEEQGSLYSIDSKFEYGAGDWYIIMLAFSVPEGGYRY